VIEAIEHAAAGLLTVGGKLSSSNSAARGQASRETQRSGTKKDKKKEK
jgi:hypothetical protein